MDEGFGATVPSETLVPGCFGQEDHCVSLYSALILALAASYPASFPYIIPSSNLHRRKTPGAVPLGVATFVDWKGQTCAEPHRDGRGGTGHPGLVSLCWGTEDNSPLPPLCPGCRGLHAAAHITLPMGVCTVRK